MQIYEFKTLILHQIGDWEIHSLTGLPRFTTAMVLFRIEYQNTEWCVKLLKRKRSKETGERHIFVCVTRSLVSVFY